MPEEYKALAFARKAKAPKLLCHASACDKDGGYQVKYLLGLTRTFCQTNCANSSTICLRTNVLCSAETCGGQNRSQLPQAPISMSIDFFLEPLRASEESQFLELPTQPIEAFLASKPDRAAARQVRPRLPISPRGSFKNNSSTKRGTVASAIAMASAHCSFLRLLNGFSAMAGVAGSGKSFSRRGHTRWVVRSSGNFVVATLHSHLATHAVRAIQAAAREVFVQVA